MGNVYMEADQVRFKDSAYRDVQAALAAALEGGGGGGTTVVANPEGSATADLAKLQVGDNIYGIPAEAGDISYDNTSSGMTADDVQEAIDELNTGLSGVTDLIPSDATSSNKLATADDIPGVATTSAPGIVQPDGTSITIADGVISAVGGSGAGEVYSATPVKVGTWLGDDLYRVVISGGALPTGASGDTVKEVNASVITGPIVMATAFARGGSYGINWLPIPYCSAAQVTSNIAFRYVNDNTGNKFIATVGDGNDQSGNSLFIVAYFTAS